MKTAFKSYRTCVACTSLALARSTSLFSTDGERLYFHIRLLPLHGELVLGWGRKWSGQRAVEIATAKDKEFQLVEDGFMPSVERKDAPLSLFVEDLGIYYDASAPHAFFRASWVTLLRHLKALFACEPFIDIPRSVPD